MSNIRKHIDRVNRYVVDELVAETARNRYRQSDVASHLGISQGAVSERFRHKVALSAGEFVVWCDLVNMDPVRVLEVALGRLGEAGEDPGDWISLSRPALETVPAMDYFELMKPEIVSPSQEDLDLVAKNPGREPDGDDEHFM